jgi:hypothetical protein
MNASSLEVRCVCRHEWPRYVIVHGEDGTFWTGDGWGMIREAMFYARAKTAANDCMKLKRDIGDGDEHGTFDR